METVLFSRKLHDLFGVTDHRKTDTHQRLISYRFSCFSGNDRLEMITDQFFPDQLLEFLPLLRVNSCLLINFRIKFPQCSLGKALCLVHGKIRILLHRHKVFAVFRIPGDAAGDAQMQFPAAWKHHGTLIHRLLQLSDFLPYLLLTVISIEQHIEFITGNPGANAFRWCIPRKTLAGSPDILISTVMTKGIVGVLQIIQIDHKQGCMLQLKRLLEKLLTLSLKGTAAVQPRQRIIIPFMLNAQPLSGNRRHILHQTYLRMVLLCGLHPHITDVSIRKSYMVDPVSCITFAGWTIAAKIPQDLLKVLSTQIFLSFLRHTEDTEKVLRHIDLR